MTEKILIGKVTKGVGGRYKVLSDGVLYNCSPRGRIKLDDKLFVGDNVKIKKEHGNYVIEEILPRTNLLRRPYVANVDLLVIVVASIPEPDWILVDKLLIFAAQYNIPAIICYNKEDLGKDALDYAQRVYSPFVKVITVSALTGQGLSQLQGYFKGVVCFAGQSAVGKSSLLNALCNLKQEIGDLSKIERGRNTTRHIEIFPLTNDNYVVDTCGFSLLELEGINEWELSLYYPDFLEIGKCKFNMCTHRDEPECVVKDNVEIGKIDKGRYERYLSIFEELKETRLKKQN